MQTKTKKNFIEEYHLSPDTFNQNNYKLTDFDIPAKYQKLNVKIKMDTKERAASYDFKSKTILLRPSLSELFVWEALIHEAEHALKDESSEDDFYNPTRQEAAPYIEGLKYSILQFPNKWTADKIQTRMKEILYVLRGKEDRQKFISEMTSVLKRYKTPEEFGKPIPIEPEKPKVIGAPSKQEQALREAREKSHEGQRLKGQQVLTSAISTSHRLEEFEVKPPIAQTRQPVKFKLPAPISREQLLRGMRTPYQPLRQPTPRLYAMSEEQSDIEEEREAMEMARQTVGRITENKLKMQIEREKRGD